MTRFESFLASLVAAIPVGTMTAQLVMSLLSYSDRMSTLMTALVGGTTVLGGLVTIGIPSFLLIAGTGKKGQEGSSAMSGRKAAPAVAGAAESVEELDASQVSDDELLDDVAETNFGMEPVEDSQEFAETVEFDTGDFDMSGESFGEVDDTDQIIEEDDDEIQFFDEEEDEKPKKKKKK